MKNYLSFRYYEFNASVVRELVGHKLSQRQRKELDEVSEKTQVRLRSCRRQFDNIKRISRAIEEHKNVNVFKEIFLLEDKMIEYKTFFFCSNPLFMCYNF